MPGQYGTHYTDNNGSQYNWNESLGKYERMKRNQRDLSNNATVNTSAFAQQFKNRRAIKVNPDGKVRKTVKGDSNSQNKESLISSESIVKVIQLAKQNYTINDIISKTGLTESQVNRVIALAIEKGHKIGKKTEKEILDEQLFEYLQFNESDEEIQKALVEDSEILQKAKGLAFLPDALPVSLDKLSNLMKSRTDYKIAQEGHYH